MNFGYERVDRVVIVDAKAAHTWLGPQEKQCIDFHHDPYNADAPYGEVVEMTTTATGIEGWSNTGVLDIPLVNGTKARRPYLMIVGQKEGAPAMLLVTGYEMDAPPTDRPRAWQFANRGESLAMVAALRVANVNGAPYPDALKKLTMWAKKHTDGVKVTPHRLAAASASRRSAYASTIFIRAS